MKKFLLATLVLLLSFGSAQKSIDINVVNGHPAVFLWVSQLTKTFIPAVDAALDGTAYSANWEEFYGGTLAKVGGELETLEAGLAEIGIVPTVFEPSNLPLQNVTYVSPFGSADPGVVANILNEMHQNIPAMIESWESFDLEYLGSGFTLDNYMLMTKFPVNSLDDLKGKKIGAPGAAVNWLDGTGAVGVAGNLTTYYNDIQTGVYDGVIVFATAAAPSKLYEVAPYITLTNFGSQYAGALVANKTWYDSQASEVQAALRAGAAAYGIGFEEAIKARTAASLEAMAAAGAIISELPDDVKVAWAASLPNVPQKWARDLDAKGLPGSEVLAAFMQGLRDAGETPARDWDKE